VVKWKKLLRQLRMVPKPLLKVLADAAVDPAEADVDPRDTVAQVSSIKHLLHV
jgi:hypothetical protein